MNTIILIVCIVVIIILIALIVAEVIGINVSSDMRRIRKETQSRYEQNIEHQKTVASQSDAQAAAEKAEADARAKELEELNKQLNEQQIQAEIQRKNDMIADQLAISNSEIIVAPMKNIEKYTMDPQQKVDYYTEGTRGYNERSDDVKFRNMFKAITGDEVEWKLIKPEESSDDT